MPRDIARRLARLEAKAEDLDVPCWIVLTAPEEAVTELHGGGQSIAREPGERWEDFLARAQGAIRRHCLTGTGVLSLLEWEAAAHEHYVNNPATMADTSGK